MEKCPQLADNRQKRNDTDKSLLWTGQQYGQTFMCISMATDQLKSIGKQLTFNNPFIYHTSLPSWTDQYPDLVRLGEFSYFII